MNAGGGDCFEHLTLDVEIHPIGIGKRIAQLQLELKARAERDGQR